MVSDHRSPLTHDGGKMTSHLSRFARLALLVCLFTLLGAPAVLADDEPIAYIGHGGFFDQKGNQIAVTVPWMAQTQEWYRRKLMAALPKEKKSAFADYHKRLNASVRGEG